MASKSKTCSAETLGREDDIDLSDKFLVESSVPTQGKIWAVQFDLSSDLFLSREDLIAEQKKDPALTNLDQTVVSETEADKAPVCYFVRNGVLMRKLRTPYVSADEEWKVVNQLVVPKPY